MERSIGASVVEAESAVTIDVNSEPICVVIIWACPKNRVVCRRVNFRQKCGVAGVMEGKRGIDDNSIVHAIKTKRLSDLAGGKGCPVFQRPIVTFSIALWRFPHRLRRDQRLRNFRGDLAVMYLVELDAANGKLVTARLVPMQMRRFQLERASADDSKRLCNLLNQLGERFGTAATLKDDNNSALKWS
jgi:hypothetical protein